MLYNKNIVSEINFKYHKQMYKNTRTVIVVVLIIECSSLDVLNYEKICSKVRVARQYSHKTYYDVQKPGNNASAMNPLLNQTLGNVDKYVYGLVYMILSKVTKQNVQQKLW